MSTTVRRCGRHVKSKYEAIRKYLQHLEYLDNIYSTGHRKEILRELHLRKNVPTLTSCPTCGRTQIDLIPIAKKVEEYLNTVNKDIHVAVMGCIVNGPGEAKEADIGIAGGVKKAAIFKNGKTIRTVDEENIIEELKKEIDLL